MGGFYREGTTFGKPEDLLKEWWVQMEGLNSLLLMHERYASETGSYFQAFQKQWEFIENYQRDSEFHGFYEMVERMESLPSKARGAFGRGHTMMAARFSM